MRSLFSQMKLEKNENCILYDNTDRIKWRIRNSKNEESLIFSVCFSLPAPDVHAMDDADKLRRKYETTVTTWQMKHLRLRQNMIFATIKVRKSLF